MTIVDPEAPTWGSPNLMHDLILAMVCDTVQEAVDSGKTAREGGELALAKLRNRRWDKVWMDFFGASALGAQWYGHKVTPGRRQLEGALSMVSEKNQPAATPVQPEQVLPVDSDAELDALVAEKSAEAQMKPDVVLPALRPREAPAHFGRPSSVALLSKDIEKLLRTQMRVVGIYSRAGDLKRKDVQTLIEENRERTKSYVIGQKLRRDRFARLVGYYPDDYTNLRDLVVSGRISHEELRAFVDATC